MISESTVVVTTVHEAQVVDAGRIPETAHDFRLHLIVTPERVVTCRPAGRRREASPAIRWEELTEEKVAAIPLLRRLRDGP